MPRRRSKSARSERDPEALFRRLRRTNDPDLRQQLIMSHEKLVRFLAQKFANRGEPLDDLVQVGMIGLINAVDRFDPARGNRFATFATPTIMGEIKRYFRDRGWAIKVPRRLQEINLKTTRAVETLTQELGRAPTIPEIAASIDESVEDTLEAWELGQHYELASLDSELGHEEEDSHSVLADYIGQTDVTVEDFGLRDRLEEAISHLPPRERTIVKMRFHRGLSQTEVARRLNISQMHVSRLQHKAIARLKELVRESD
jgi:RNA polymerase sigma-B factor